MLDNNCQSENNFNQNTVGTTEIQACGERSSVSEMSCSCSMKQETKTIFSRFVVQKKNVSAEMKIIKNPLEIPDDGKLYDIRSITGTESEMSEFYQTHKKDCIAVPYDAGNGLWQVNYYQEITEEEYKNRYRNLIVPNSCQKA